MVIHNQINPYQAGSSYIRKFFYEPRHFANVSVSMSDVCIINIKCDVTWINDALSEIYIHFFMGIKPVPVRRAGRVPSSHSATRRLRAILDVPHCQFSRSLVMLIFMQPQNCRRHVCSTAKALSHEM